MTTSRIIPTRIGDWTPLFSIPFSSANMLRILLALLAVTFALNFAEAERLSSLKQPISITFDPPAGWHGPGYTASPSYEAWSFSRGRDPDIAYIEIRVDPQRASEMDWNTATEEQIRKTFDDFMNPTIEKLANVIIDNTPVTVWAAYNVDGEFLIAKFRCECCDLNFSLQANSRAELRRYRKTFLEVLKSIQINKGRKAERGDRGQI
jgi:hypothetical protein